VIIFIEPDELLECDHCGGTGVICVDVYAHTDVGFDIIRSGKWDCGVCGGEGALIPHIQLELEEHD